jgi:hypothetical protein
MPSRTGSITSRTMMSNSATPAQSRGGPRATRDSTGCCCTPCMAQRATPEGADEHLTPKRRVTLYYRAHVSGVAGGYFSCRGRCVRCVCPKAAQRRISDIASLEGPNKAGCATCPTIPIGRLSVDHEQELVKSRSAGSTPGEGTHYSLGWVPRAIRPWATTEDAGSG